MKKILFIISCTLCLAITAQTKVQQIEGNWLIADLDNSLVNFYKNTDGYWYAKILKSDKAIYINQVIYKGKATESFSHLDGTFTTPKSKMNISTKVYVDSESQIRMVGKKYFITKTYKGIRHK